MGQCAWENRYSLTQLARWNQAIPGRYSCRVFAGDAPIDSKAALHYMAARAELPGVRLAFSQGEAGRVFLPLPFVDRIANTRDYAAILVDAAHPLASLHGGVAGEALVLEAASLGLGTCWVSGSFRKSRVDIPLKKGEKIAALIPFGQPPHQEGVPGRRRKTLPELCLDDPSLWPNWAFQAAEAVRAAPSAVNLQPWRFSFTGNTLRLGGRGFPSLNFGIAVTHILCALHDFPHRWRMAADGDSLLIISEDP